MEGAYFGGWEMLEVWEDETETRRLYEDTNNGRFPAPTRAIGDGSGDSIAANGMSGYPQLRTTKTAERTWLQMSTKPGICLAYVHFACRSALFDGFYWIHCRKR
jgi:hypothetical protein